MAWPEITATPNVQATHSNEVSGIDDSTTGLWNATWAPLEYLEMVEVRRPQAGLFLVPADQNMHRINSGVSRKAEKQEHSDASAR